MSTDTTEKGLEALITNYLCDGGDTVGHGFVRREYAQYNRTDCIDEELLFRFLELTQTIEVEKLKAIHGDLYQQKILSRINQKIKDQTVVKEKCLGGIVELMRVGITDNNIKLKLFYDKPTQLGNEKDWERYNQNIFSATRQVHYSNANNNSLDIVIFLNGLPIITFELKNELTKQNVKDAIKQYKNQRDPKEELFRLGRCLVHFAVDTEQVWMCTHLKGNSSVFLPFNKGDDDGAGNPVNKNGIKADYLWKEILSKESLCNIIMNYVQLVEEDVERILPTGEIKKEKSRKLIFPRFHQLDVVKYLLKDAKANGTGKRYLIQHSAGSGKSNSISWLAHQLVGLHDANDTRNVFDSVIVVTDRRVLDAQIRKNVQQFEQVKGVVEAITEGSKQLKHALESGKKIIITTIQKFPYIVDEIGDLPATKFAILIDEAHSGQSGNASGSLNMALEEDVEYASGEDQNTDEDKIYEIVKNRKFLKNASYFAFTATPKNKTLELFGLAYEQEGETKYRAHSLYSMKQAIEEGFIRDVLENYTTYKSYYGLLKKIEEDPQYDTKKAQKKLKAYVEGNEFAIAQKTEVMIRHFLDSVVAKRKINGLAKAMVVTSSRKNAVQYKRAFDAYLSAIKNPFKSIVAFSGDIDKQTEASLNGFSSGEITEKFKQYEYRFLIVASKFQTGFDQPLLHTMYVDKKLGGVTAVQTLSRLNRTMPGKEDTFVLDFANETEDIKKSFDPFFKTTILSGSTDANKLFDLQNALDAYQIYTHEQVVDFTHKILNDAPLASLHAILDEVAAHFRNDLDEDAQEDFRTKCKSYVRFYIFVSQIIDFVNPYLEQLYQFLKQLQNKLVRERDEDLARGILDNIDMDSYRLQIQANQHRIELEQGDPLRPVPPGMRGGAADIEIDALSNILRTFNDRFGTEFTDQDKVRRMAEEVMQDVAQDEEFINSMNHSDKQNARITFDKVLDDKLIGHINSNFEFFKKYNDDPEFKNFFAGALFNLLANAMNNQPAK
jgi:type I restriction enzyme R subunit